MALYEFKVFQKAKNKNLPVKLFTNLIEEFSENPFFKIHLDLNNNYKEKVDENRNSEFALNYDDTWKAQIEYIDSIAAEYSVSQVNDLLWSSYIYGLNINGVYDKFNPEIDNNNFNLFKDLVKIKEKEKLDKNIGPEIGITKDIVFNPNKSEQTEDPLSNEDIDKCILGRLNLKNMFKKLDTVYEQELLDYAKKLSEGKSKKLEKPVRKKAIVVSAPFGSGKTLRLCQYIAFSGDDEMGLILIKTNEDSQKMYDQIIHLNKDKRNSVVVFNTDPRNKELYDYIIENPRALKKYNWVICCVTRWSTDSRIILDRITSVSDNEDNSDVYIISDEAITCSFSLRVTSDTMLNYVINFPEMANFISGGNSEEELNNSRKLVYDLLKELSKKTKAGFFNDNDDKVINFNNHVITKSEVNLLLGYLSPNYSTVPGRMLSKFELNRSLEMFKRLLDYIDSHRKEVNDLLNRARRDKLGKINDIIIPMSIDEVVNDYKVLIFDASADLNYKDSKLFYIEDFGIPKPKGLTKFHRINKMAPQRHLRQDCINYLNEIFNPENCIIKNNSVVIWVSDIYDGFIPGTRRPNKEEGHCTSLKPLVEELMYKCGLKNTYFIFFNGGDIKGSNIYRNCENVYILGCFYPNQNAVQELRNAGAGAVSKQTIFLDQCSQGICRTRIRNHQPIDVYFTKFYDIETSGNPGIDTYNMTEKLMSIFSDEPIKDFIPETEDDYKFMMKYLWRKSYGTIKGPTKDALLKLSNLKTITERNLIDLGFDDREKKKSIIKKIKLLGLNYVGPE